MLQSITEYYRILQSISSASTWTNFWACFSKIPQDFELLKQVLESSHQTSYFGLNQYNGPLILSLSAFPRIVRRIDHQWLATKPMLSSSPIVDSPKALAIPHYIGQNGCLPSFYVIFTSTHDELVEMTRHGRWIITDGSSGQWLATIENQCFHRVQWLTLQKPLPFHIGQND